MLRLAWLALLVALVPSAARATALDPDFIESDFVVSSELNGTTALAWAPDGSNRLFVTRQNGQIRIVKNGQLLPAPFATVDPLFYSGECGLLGITFDQDFLANHWVYVFATVSTSEQQIIRYTVSGDAGVEKKTIVAGLPTRGVNHDGGALGVGPDGKLYWAIGDNGAGIGVGADLASLAAKVGRANPDGTAPADNPFHDGGGGPRDFIWARGMRNPFTLAFQPASGLLWLNVVGDAFEQVFIVNKGDHGGYGSQEANQQPPNIRPVIKYRTNGAQVLNIRPTTMNGAARSNGVVTFTVGDNHYLRVGEKVTVSQVADPSFDGTFFVAAVPTETSFTVVQAGPDATSGSAGAAVATAVTGTFGGCVTGGDFWDSSQVPLRYRGNFFFGDYNNIASEPGRMLRAAIDPATNTITSVDLWAKDLPYQVDVAVGPDGALYYASHVTYNLWRAAYKPSAQGLVVTPLNVWTGEGASAVVNVRLAMAPASDVVVNVARSGGASDIAVTTGNTLTFTTTNWSVPQTTTITAAEDRNATDDVAVLSVTAAGLAAETVTVHAHDKVAPPPNDAAALDAGGPDAGPPDALDAAADGAADAPLEADAAAPDVAAASDAAAEAGQTDGPGRLLEKPGGGCDCRLGGRGAPGGAVLVLALAGWCRGRRRGKSPGSRAQL